MSENEIYSDSFNKSDISITKAFEINEEEMSQAIKYTKLYGICHTDWENMKEYIKHCFLNVIKNYFEKNKNIEVENIYNKSDSNIVNEIEMSNALEGEGKSNHSIPENKNNISSFISASISSKLYIKPEPTYEEIINNINKLKTIPFTIQRICELLQDPTRNYKTKSNFISAFSKLTNIDA